MDSMDWFNGNLKSPFKDNRSLRANMDGIQTTQIRALASDLTVNRLLEKRLDHG